MSEMEPKIIAFRREAFGTLMITICVICVGLSYVCVRYSRLYTDVSPLTFCACASFCGVLLQIITHGTTMLIFQDSFKILVAEISVPNFWRNIIYHGSVVGLFFIVSWFLSIYATITETTGQTTFIIGMYVIFVPVVESALHSFVKCPPHRTWLSTVLVFVGVFFLSDCATENCFEDYDNVGVLFALMSMFGIVGQLIATSRALKVVSAAPLVFATFCFGCAFVTILALIFESDFYTSSGWEGISSAWRVIALDAIFDYFGSLFLATGMTYLTPERATILLSLDSLSGAFFGWVILGEAFYGLEYLGGCLMLVAVGFELFLTDDLTCDMKKIEVDCLLHTDEKEDEENIKEMPHEKTPLLI